MERIWNVVLALGGMMMLSSAAAAQVVLDMPPPPKKAAPDVPAAVAPPATAAARSARQTPASAAAVGDLALARYSGARTRSYHTYWDAGQRRRYGYGYGHYWPPIYGYPYFWGGYSRSWVTLNPTFTTIKIVPGESIEQITEPCD